MDHRFVHLCAHSAHSVGVGAIDPATLPEAAARLGMGAVGLSDINSLAGFPAFLASASRHGVTGIPGLQLTVEHVVRGQLSLLALDETGLRSLVEVHNAMAGAPEGVLGLDAITRPGLAVLTGGPDGLLARALGNNNPELPWAILTVLKNAFGDRLHIEIQRHGQGPSTGDRSEGQLIALARRHGVPLVATGTPCFLEPGQADDHRLMMAVACRVPLATIPRDDYRERWFQDQEAMLQLFADLPEACAATVTLASRVRFMADPQAVFRPATMPVAALRDRAASGLDARMEGRPDSERDPYRTRLTKEIEAVERTGAVGHLASAERVASTARQARLPIGPGRGSAAGSLVAWALGITDVDPVRHGLSGGRFLHGPGGPHIDLDVSASKRDQILTRLGSGAIPVAHHHRPRGVTLLLAVADALGLETGTADGLRGVAVDPNLASPLADAFAEQRTAVERHGDNAVRAFEMAIRLERLPFFTTVGKHSAALVIMDAAPGACLPVVRHVDGSPLVCFDRETLRALGVPTVGVLGLASLDMLDEVAGSQAWTAVDPNDEDPAVMGLLATGDTLEVFQFSSEFMRALLTRVAPRSIAELAALIALGRPGRTALLDDWLDRRNGLRRAKPPHPLLAPLLIDTHGLLVFQEQVIAILEAVVGLDEPEAVQTAHRLMRWQSLDAREQDTLRRRINDGMAALGHSARDAERVHHVLATRAATTFSKAHATAYATLAYRTAWARVHRRTEWTQRRLLRHLGSADNVRALLDNPRAMQALRECGAL